MTDRASVLNSLIQPDRPIDQIRAELRTFPWGHPNELITLTAEHIRSVLTRLTSGTLSADTVCKWADAIEMREDIGYEERYHEEIVEAISALAYPLLNGALDPDEIARLFA